MLRAEIENLNPTLNILNFRDYEPRTGLDWLFQRAQAKKNTKTVLILTKKIFLFSKKTGVTINSSLSTPSS
jgi:hypothetical protein